MTHPVGFEILREHFGDIPEWRDVSFYFGAHPTTFASEFARLLRSGEPYCIFRVERRPDSYIPSIFPAHWAFTVYSVPRAFKSIARAALSSGMVAAFRDFISHSPTHAHYYNRCEALFDPAEGSCTTRVFRGR